MTKKSKECILCFDEMAIKKDISFNKARGCIEGAEDLREFGRKPLLAKSVLVLMLRGVYSSWKLPISFYFTHSSVSGNDLTEIVKRNLIELQQIGFFLLE